MRISMSIAVAVCLIVANISARRPEFEVATVKLSAPVPFGQPIGINLGTFRHGALTMTNVTLADCLQYAHALVSKDQVAGPDWIKSYETRFDIVAKTTAETSLDDARRMLRSLLADRLKLTTRTEQRRFSFVALVPARSGAKLVPAKEGDDTPGSGGAGRIAGRQMPIAVVASLLSRLEGQLFVDRTGLTGRYQIDLEWVPENDPNRNGLSLAEALDTRLGLRMERRREPLDVVVVEKAEQIPTDN
jgi:uncharacterized protein (TIGR03435 family)